MPQDKYTAVWVSHTSISDFLRCPRAYFLKHVYKDPKTGHKVKLMSPPLALGQAVHEVLESLSQLPTEKRFAQSLMTRYESAWEKVKGKRGGFTNDETELKYKNRGGEMLRRVMNHPGPIAGLAVKIQQDLPYFWLSEEDNIILCGKIDWLEYLPEIDSVHIIDFKTGKHEESGESLQLPIYHLLVNRCQKRTVDRASYWYLDHEDTLTEKALPNLDEAYAKVLEIAREVKLSRQLNRLKCKSEGGCYSCRSMEAIMNHEAEFVDVDEYKYDVYILNNPMQEEEGSVIL